MHTRLHATYVLRIWHTYITTRKRSSNHAVRTYLQLARERRRTQTSGRIYALVYIATLRVFGGGMETQFRRPRCRHLSTDGSRRLQSYFSWLCSSFGPSPAAGPPNAAARISLDRPAGRASISSVPFAIRKRLGSWRSLKNPAGRLLSSSPYAALSYPGISLARPTAAASILYRALIVSCPSASNQRPAGRPAA